MSAGWSWYVIVLVVGNIIGCVWLLRWTAKRGPNDPRPDETSHFWDGDITEYNQPLPRWWINLFYLTIAFSIAYLVWYPGLGNFAGIGQWTSSGEHDADRQQRDSRLETTFSAYVDQPIDVLATDPQAVALGRSIFNNTCAACHGSSAQGAPGYPNLADSVWNWGGDPEQILATVLDGREGVMPALGTVLEGMGGEFAVNDTIAYVRKLRLRDPARGDNIMSVRGKKYFDGLCVACHGAEGTGNPQLGAPDLTQRTGLYSTSDESVRETIMNGRHGIMPAHRALLGETRSRLAAAYVWSLSAPAGDDDKPAR